MPSRRPLRERFDEKYEIDPATGCWNWTACTGRWGYGKIGSGIGKTTLWAYRAAYILFKGPVPAGLAIDHLCRNTPDNIYRTGNRQECATCCRKNVSNYRARKKAAAAGPGAAA